MAGRLDGGGGVAYTKTHNGNGSASDGERWARSSDREARTMNTVDGHRTMLVIGMTGTADLDPLGLDSHRYRCCGNGVVAPVAEWIGQRLAAALS
jgi:site-specific DNA-cytosine methylase